MLGRIIRRLVLRFDPDRIILFGSPLAGVPALSDDADLLVVMPISGSRRAKQLEIRLVLREFGIARDVMVAAPEEFARRGGLAGALPGPAQGTILYVRPEARRSGPQPLERPVIPPSATVERPRRRRAS